MIRNHPPHTSRWASRGGYFGSVVACLLVLTALACLSEISIGSRNRYYLSYVRTFLSGELATTSLSQPPVRASATSHSTRPSGRELCMAGNLASALGDAEHAVSLWALAGDDCFRIVALNETSVSLIPSQFFGPLVDRLSTGHLLFRRNTGVWQALFVPEPAKYRLAVRGQCEGPEPALLRVQAGDIDRLLEFGTQPTEQSLLIPFDRGYNVLIIAFVNDYYGELGDRNLRILEVSADCPFG